MELHAVPAVQGVYAIRAETTGYLIVRGQESLLIDCPAGDVVAACRAAGVPLPATILHTQVQAEHCHEWASLPAAAVHVPAGCSDVATRAERFYQDLNTVWPPSRDWDYRGVEKYGLAGCCTERPPAQPLRVLGELAPGASFAWHDVTLAVLALPGHGKRSIGLWWAAAGVLFSGDLVAAGGYLVNFYDIERAYGPLLGYDELRASLATVEALPPTLLLPSTGAAITDFAADLAALRGRLAWLSAPPLRRAGQPGGIINFTPRREFGRYREVAPGVYQNTNFGNVVLFVRADGNGLLFDPDFCVWKTWEENVREWNADLDLLQRETGLRRVEWAIATHYHGDHVQYADELRKRYGTTFLAAPDVAAVIERPAEFRYPCTIDWYGFPYVRLAVDRRLAYEQPVPWHDTTITPIHTPGHCNAHSSFLVDWQGTRYLVAGDVIQYGAGAIAASLPIMWNDNAWPTRGVQTTFARLQHRGVQWILGGHSHACHDPAGAALADMAAVADEALALTRAMVADGDTLRAMTPPGFDARRPATA